MFGSEGRTSNAERPTSNCRIRAGGLSVRQVAGWRRREVLRPRLVIPSRRSTAEGSPEGFLALPYRGASAGSTSRSRDMSTNSVAEIPRPSSRLGMTVCQAAQDSRSQRSPFPPSNVELQNRRGRGGRPAGCALSAARGFAPTTGHPEPAQHGRGISRKLSCFALPWSFGRVHVSIERYVHKLRRRDPSAVFAARDDSLPGCAGFALPAFPVPNVQRRTTESARQGRTSGRLRAGGGARFCAHDWSSRAGAARPRDLPKASLLRVTVGASAGSTSRSRNMSTNSVAEIPRPSSRLGMTAGQGGWKSRSWPPLSSVPLPHPKKGPVSQQSKTGP